MQRSILLAKKPKQMTYHRFKNVKLVQRKEDNNTILQGEHCVVVLEEMETYIWERCLGVKTINDIINDIMLLDDYKLNDRQDIENVVVDFINDLLEQELIELV